MPAEIPKPSRFTLLETLSSLKGVPLKGIYSLADVAALFDVSKRTIQSSVKRGNLPVRNLPGRCKFLPADLEAFLTNSKS